MEIVCDEILRIFRRLNNRLKANTSRRAKAWVAPLGLFGTSLIGLWGFLSNFKPWINFSTRWLRYLFNSLETPVGFQASLRHDQRLVLIKYVEDEILVLGCNCFLALLLINFKNLVITMMSYMHFSAIECWTISWCWRWVHLYALQRVFRAVFCSRWPNNNASTLAINLLLCRDTITPIVILLSHGKLCRASTVDWRSNLCVILPFFLRNCKSQVFVWLSIPMNVLNVNGWTISILCYDTLASMFVLCWWRRKFSIV